MVYICKKINKGKFTFHAKHVNRRKIDHSGSAKHNTGKHMGKLRNMHLILEHESQEKTKFILNEGRYKNNIPLVQRKGISPYFVSSASNLLIVTLSI